MSKSKFKDHFEKGEDLEENDPDLNLFFGLFLDKLNEITRVD